MKKSYDVIVVGGGPIGSYTAYQLADKGFDVCVLDEKKEIGKNVICAGVMSKEAFKRYDLPSESIVSRIDSVSFISPYGQRLEYKPKDVLAYVVDREVFDKGLMTLAQKCGVDIYLKQRVTHIHESSNLYSVVSRNKRFRSKAVVLATGIDHVLHRKLGFGKTHSFLYGSQIEIPLSCAPSKVEIHIGRSFAPGSFGWVIPGGNNTSKVGVIVRRKGKKWLQRMLEKRLHIPASKFSDSAFKVKPIAYGPIKRSVKKNILVVGEAAGQVKTTTGGGIFYGLLCSEIAVDKLSNTLKSGSSLHDYEMTWRSVLISELDIGKRLRKIATQLSDGDIERLFSFVKKNRFWVQLLVPRINFDYHSNFIFFCMESFGHLLGPSLEK